jgi:hypothetical protein
MQVRINYRLPDRIRLKMLGYFRGMDFAEFN